MLLRSLRTLLSPTWPGDISHFSGYVDNPGSTPYPPRETVAHGEGERYGRATSYPSAPGVPAAPAAGDVQPGESRMHCRLFGLFARPPLYPVGPGRDDPRPEKLRRPDASGAAARPL